MLRLASKNNFNISLGFKTLYLTLHLIKFKFIKNVKRLH